jgi:hypothetical protein
MVRLAFFKSILNQKAGLNSDIVAGPVARLELSQALTAQFTAIRVGWLKKLGNTMRYDAESSRVGVRDAPPHVSDTQKSEHRAKKCVRYFVGTMRHFKDLERQLQFCRNASLSRIAH